MNEQRNNDDRQSRIRRRAEEKFRTNRQNFPPPDDVLAVFNELQVHQIELEMQNEELLRSELNLQEARQKYFDLYNLAPVGYLSVDKDGLIREANLTAAELFNTAREKIINVPVSTFIVDDDQDTYYLRRNTLIQTRGRQQFELRMKRKPDREFTGQIVSVLTTDSTGSVFHNISVTDISDRVKSEQIIHDLRRRESIGVLATGLAHDFNNLLQTISANISLVQLQSGPADPSAKNLTEAMKALKRASDLVRQMLGLCGLGQFRNIPVDIGRLIQENLTTLEAALPATVTLKTTITPESLVLSGDPNQFLQVLLNLVTNAGEAIADKSGTVHIELSPVQLTAEDLVPFNAITGLVLPASDYALLRITDTGTGMNTDVLSRIFDPFFSTKFVGRGLGLSAVLGIVRAHLGGITVTSAEGKGTIFSLVLPTAQGTVATKKVKIS